MSKKNYWAERQAQIQNAIGDKTIADCEKQLKKYYRQTQATVINDFIHTYEKLLTTVNAGKEPTPADLYNLDRYWKLQAQLKVEMNKLGEKEINLLSNAFEKEWEAVYKAVSLPSDAAFTYLGTDSARAMIDNVWLIDGKNFSQRIWKHTEELVETLNEKLIACVVSGKSPRDLKNELRERFRVSYEVADTLVKTETANIQTQAAAQRYKDMGAKQYEFFADSDERTCRHKKINCNDLDGKRFFFAEMEVGKNAPPIHPRCRCCITPIVDVSSGVKTQ